MTYKDDPFYIQIIPLVLNAEGGYVNHPNDPGGETKYGIAFNYQKNNLAKMGIHSVKDLTLDQAREFYYEFFWKACKADKIPDINLAYLHFDSAIQHGIGIANRFLAALKPQPQFFEGNGKNSFLFNKLFQQYYADRLKYYSTIIVRNAKLRVFAAGWLNRMAHLLDNLDKLKQG